MKFSLFSLVILSFLFVFPTESRGSKGKDIPGCDCNLLQSRRRNANKTGNIPWEPDKNWNIGCIPKIGCDCPPENEKYSDCEREINGPRGMEDDPEEWFVKVFRKPDTHPSKYILFSINSDNGNGIINLNEWECEDGKDEKSFPDFGKNEGIEIKGEFGKCLLESERESVILKCFPVSSVPNNCKKILNRRIRPLILRTRFLQVNEPEKPKYSILESVTGKSFSVN